MNQLRNPKIDLSLTLLAENSKAIVEQKLSPDSNVIRALVDERRQIKADIQIQKTQFDAAFTSTDSISDEMNEEAEDFVANWITGLKSAPVSIVDFDDEHFCQIFLDQILPNAWHFKNNAIVIIDPPSETISTCAKRRGQQHVIIYYSNKENVQYDAVEEKKPAHLTCKSLEDLEKAFALIQIPAGQIITIPCVPQTQEAQQSIEDAINAGKWTRFENTRTVSKIEGFDISHTSGKNVSASCVSITKDGPSKKNYRIMNIKKDSNNDYLALSEAIQRRCKNLQKNDLSLPEVILLDGGKGQLNTVEKNIDEKLLKKITIISVSKGPNRNEKYDLLHYDKNNFELKDKEEITKIIQLVRNESHRFAINHHRKRRSKELFSSNLDGIDGLGSKLKTNLIRYFGGLDKITEASIDDLKSAPGIGESKAKKIHSYFKRN